MLPASVRLKVVASAACRGRSGLNGVTELVNGLSAAKAVYREDGTASGTEDMNGERIEGVE